MNMACTKPLLASRNLSCSYTVKTLKLPNIYKKYSRIILSDAQRNLFIPVMGSSDVF